jgi:hypothetical protein
VPLFQPVKSRVSRDKAAVHRLSFNPLYLLSLSHHTILYINSRPVQHTSIGFSIPQIPSNQLKEETSNITYDGVP